MLLQKGYRWACVVILCSTIFLSCNVDKTVSSSQIWIDVPLDGLDLVGLEPIDIKGHASSLAGVSRVDIFINENLTYSLEGLSTQGNLAHFLVKWTPPELGEYAIKAVVYADGNTTGTSDIAHVSFGGQSEVSTETPVVEQITPTRQVATTTPTNLPPTTSVTPETIIQFWAEPITIQAGACTTLYWRVENGEQVVFGGLQQPFEGSYKDCLCKSSRYTLTVIDNAGEQQKSTVDITVTGTCATPTPSPTPPPIPSPTPPDASPPPPPTPVVPANDLVLSCRSTLDLAWLPVEDPSGISEYQVQVQRHAGDNNWQDVSGSIFSGILNKETNIPVECAWYYRWRVRAIDGAGNVGTWSIWSAFIITIG